MEVLVVAAAPRRGIRDRLSQQGAQIADVFFGQPPFELVEHSVTHAGRFANLRSAMIGLEFSHQFGTSPQGSIGFAMGASVFQAGRLAR